MSLDEAFDKLRVRLPQLAEISKNLYSNPEEYYAKRIATQLDSLVQELHNSVPEETTKYTTNCKDLANQIASLNYQLGTNSDSDVEWPPILYEKYKAMLKHRIRLQEKVDAIKPAFEAQINLIKHASEYLGIPFDDSPIIFSEEQLKILTKKAAELDQTRSIKKAEVDQIISKIVTSSTFLGLEVPNFPSTATDTDVNQLNVIEDELRQKCTETESLLTKLRCQIEMLASLIEEEVSVPLSNTGEGSNESIQLLRNELRRLKELEPSRKDIFSKNISSRISQLYDELFYDTNCRIIVDSTTEITDDLLMQLKAETEKLNSMKADPVMKPILRLLNNLAKVFAHEQELISIKSDTDRYKRKGFMAALKRENQLQAQVNKQKPLIFSELKQALANYEGTFTICGQDVRQLVSKNATSQPKRRASVSKPPLETAKQIRSSNKLPSRAPKPQPSTLQARRALNGKEPPSRVTKAPLKLKPAQAKQQARPQQQPQPRPATSGIPAARKPIVESQPITEPLSIHRTRPNASNTPNHTTHTRNPPRVNKSRQLNRKPESVATNEPELDVGMSTIEILGMTDFASSGLSERASQSRQVKVPNPNNTHSTSPSSAMPADGFDFVNIPDYSYFDDVTTRLEFGSEPEDSF